MKMCKNIATKKNVVSIALAGAVVMVFVLIAGNMNVQAQEPTTENSIKVGTFDIQTVFTQHPSQSELTKMSTSIQSEMQQAQQEGNTQKIQQLQQQFEQQRMQIVQEFENSLDETIPEAAKAADVKIVATEIYYTDKDVETEDITSELIEIINKKVEEGNEEPESPEMLELPGLSE